MLSIGCALAMTCSISFGQTNSAANPQGTKPVPRPFDIKAVTEAILTERPNIASLNAASSEFRLSYNQTQIALFERIDREGLLKLRETVCDNDFERRVADAFRPQILHIGHVQIYSSVAAAIARKNPLCLADPLFLSVSY